MSRVEWNYCFKFFKQHKPAFAWTYLDLRGVRVDICEHRIILGDNAKPIRQRQYRMNPKYSLTVNEEIDKLLACGFNFSILRSE